MIRAARLFALVYDTSLAPVVGARVELTLKQDEAPRPLGFDKALQRFREDGLQPGRYRLRVSAERLAAEERDVSLVGGDNHVQVMLGTPDMASYQAGPMRVYVKTDERSRMLAVHGAHAYKVVEGLLDEQRLERSSLADTRESRRQHEWTGVVRLGEGDEAARRAKVLETLVSVELPRRGLSVRAAIPARIPGDQGDAPFGLTDEIIVRFAAHVGRDLAQRTAARLGLSVVRELSFVPNGYVLRLAQGYDFATLSKLLAVLNARADVVYAEPNLLVRLKKTTYTPNDPLLAQVPHLSVIECGDAWELLGTLPGVNRGGSPDVIVGVLDLDGVDPTHPDLTGTVSSGQPKMVVDYDFVSMSAQTFANLAGDHGTECAGSATARMDESVGIPGVAPNCRLVGAQLPGSQTLDFFADIWLWMAGLPVTRAGFPAQLAQGAAIISNSWGPTGVMAPSPVLSDAFTFLTTYGRGGRGTIMCFATGNMGYVLVDNRNPFAADPKTLAVGASINVNPTSPVNSAHANHAGTTNNLTATVDTRAFYSPYGLTVDLVAPSHTCYDATSGNKVDPIFACERVNAGRWPGNATNTTALTAAAAAGAATLSVASTAGFVVNEYAVVGDGAAGPRESRRITAIGAGQITVEALAQARAAGTVVWTGPNNDYAYDFGGTSHACPTVAGAAALLLSVKPDLTWIEVRELLRTTAVHIDAAQANAIGQWIDLDGDGTDDFSQWYGHGRLDVHAALGAAINLNLRGDMVVRDNLGDTGAVPSSGWHAESPDLWVSPTDDPIPALAYGAAPPHQNPVRGHDNYVYVRVKNVGAGPVTQAYVRALVTHFPGVEFQYPEDWQPSTAFGQNVTLPLQPGTYLIGETSIAGLAAGAETIVKMTWDKDLIPPKTVTIGATTTTWHPCLLAEVAPHDGPTPVSDAYPVKGDNNIAHRNITIDDPVGGNDAFMSAVALGTRAAKGVEAVLIDGSRLPESSVLVVRLADPARMKKWVELVQQRGLETIAPLGDDDELPRGAHPCELTLLDDARVALRCGDGRTLVVHARAHTRFELICPKSPQPAAGGPIRDGVELGERDGQPVLRLRGAARTVSVPVQLAAGEFVPLLVGVERTGRALGTIRVSQRRGDGQQSPGYTFRA